MSAPHSCKKIKQYNRELVREAYGLFVNAHLAKARFICPRCQRHIVGNKKKLQEHFQTHQRLNHINRKD